MHQLAAMQAAVCPLGDGLPPGADDARLAATAAEAELYEWEFILAAPPPEAEAEAEMADGGEQQGHGGDKGEDKEKKGGEEASDGATAEPEAGDQKVDEEGTPATPKAAAAGGGDVEVASLASPSATYL